MAIRDLFRPKWKHSSLEVRTAAVRSLDVENDVQKLIDVAKTEESATIRRVAIRKLVDIDVLNTIAADDSDSSVREAASKRREALIVDKTKTLKNGDGEALLSAINDTAGLKALLLGLDNTQLEKNTNQSAIANLQMRALDKFDSKRDLADVYRKSKSDALRQLIIPRLDDEKLVKSIVTDESRAALAMPLLGNISDTSLLEDIAKKAKLRKVRTEARKKIDGLLGKNVDPKAKLAAKKEIVRRNRLVKQAEALAQSDDWKRANEQIDTLESNWSEGSLSNTGAITDDNGLSERFSKALATFRKRYDVHQDAVRRNQARLTKQSGSHDPAPVKDTSTRTEESTRTEAQSLDTADGAKTTEPAPQVLMDILTELEIAIDMPKVDDAKIMFSKKLKATKRYTRFIESDPELSQRISAAKDILDKRIESRKLARQASQEKRIGQYAQKREKLNDLLKSDSIKECASGISHIKKTSANLTKLADSIGQKDRQPVKDQAVALASSYDELGKTLFDHLQVLKEKEDWLRWSNIKPKEALCVAAEALKTEEDLSKAFEALKKIQRDWKKTGAVPKSKSDELWKRFKTACDAAYERCKDVVGDQDKRQEDNLKRKTELCEKAEALQDSDDYNNAANALKQMQADWRKIGRVPQAQSDDIWKRFRAACDHFFNRRKGVLEELDVGRMDNLKAKQKLIAEAEAIKDSENWIATAKKLKALQIEWKKVGQVPRTHANDVWKQFRAACDFFFERKLESENKPLKDNFRACEAILVKLETLAGMPAREADRAEVDTTKANANEDDAPKDTSLSRESVTEADAIAAMSFDDDDTVEADATAASLDQGNNDTSASEPPSVDNTAAATLSDEDWLKEVMAERTAWEKRGELLPNDKKAIEKRYQVCMDALLANNTDKLKGSPLDPDTLLTKREDLCKSIEALKSELNEQAPEKATLGANAAERLKQALAENSLGIDKQKERKDKVRRKLDDLEHDWNNQLPLSSPAAKQLEQRFFKAANELRAYT